jgi:hypothetical protein
MSEIKTQVVYQFGLGGVGGFIVGFLRASKSGKRNRLNPCSTKPFITSKH